MKQYVTIFLCLLMLAGIACKKRKDVPVVYPVNELHYKETGCSDRWGAGSPNLPAEQLAIKVKDWLQQQGITVTQVKVTTGHDEIQCKSCYCPTGRRLQVLFDPGDIEKAMSFGFYKP